MVHTDLKPKKLPMYTIAALGQSALPSMELRRKYYFGSLEVMMEFRIG